MTDDARKFQVKQGLTMVPLYTKRDIVGGTFDYGGQIRTINSTFTAKGEFLSPGSQITGVVIIEPETGAKFVQRADAPDEFVELSNLQEVPA